MREDVDNIVIENVLDQNEIDQIFDIVANTDKTDFQETLSQNMWHIELPENLIDKFTKIAESVAKERLILKEYNFSKYEKVTSNCKKFEFNPILFPHVDNAFDKNRFTLDYQIRSNVDWDIVVDNWEYVNTYRLKDNQGLTFSGTHQIHWRPKREFKDGEFLEAVFLHFEPMNPTEPSQEHLDKMQERANFHFQKWEQQKGISKNPREVSQ